MDNPQENPGAAEELMRQLHEAINGAPTREEQLEREIEILEEAIHIVAIYQADNGEMQRLHSGAVEELTRTSQKLQQFGAAVAGNEAVYQAKQFELERLLRNWRSELDALRQPAGRPTRAARRMRHTRRG